MKLLTDRLQIAMIVLSLLLLCSPVGCASRRTTVTSEQSDSGDSGRTVETTTTEVTSDSGSCGGVLSCTVNVLGEIIALPFRAVGALVGAIF